MDNTERAAKRKEVQERRRLNALAKSLLPIAYKQAGIVSSAAGMSDSEETLGFAMLGIAEAMNKTNSLVLRPGFYSYVKQYARGFSLNYLRDKSRTVRLPRDLTLAYLAEQRALKTVPGYRDLCDSAKAEHLSLDLSILVESRSAIALYDRDINNFDGALLQPEQSSDLRYAAEQVQTVLDAGIRAVATAGKLDQAVVAEQFYKALAIVLESKDA